MKNSLLLLKNIMFFGPVFNATRGIASSVESAVSSFLYKCDLLRICGEKEGSEANPLHFVWISGTGCSRDLYLLSMSFLSAFS